jgi:hypothetical protein
MFVVKKRRLLLLAYIWYIILNYRFFKQYEKNILNKLTIKKKDITISLIKTEITKKKIITNSKTH